MILFPNLSTDWNDLKVVVLTDVSLCNINDETGRSYSLASRLPWKMLPTE